MANGILVIGHDNALGSGNLSWNTGHIVQAGGGERTIANNVTRRNWNYGHIFAGSNNLTITGTYDVASAFGATSFASLDVQNADAVVTLRSFLTQISGTNGGFKKLGAGMLILDGTVTPAGTPMDFTVAAGTLLMNTTAPASTGNVIVNSGATLGGTGTINVAPLKRITVDAGGNLAPGASVGTLTVNGDVDLNGALEIEIDGSGSDKLIVSGLLELDSSSSVLNVVFVEGFTPTGPAAYEILDSGTLAGSFSQVNLVQPGGFFSWDDSQLLTDGLLLLSIPEPASALLLGLAGLAALRRRR